MSHERNRFDFIDDINAFIGDPSPVNLQVAVLVVETATPNQYEDLVRLLGQAAADSFEDACAKSISACLPAPTKLYRLSTARFGCILQADTPEHVIEALDRLAHKIRYPVQTGSIPVATSVGIGIAHYPHHGTDAAELFQAATSAARESLDGGKPWCPYDPEFDRTSRRAAHLLRDIVPALAGKDQLRLIYQPKMDILTGRCIGAEALLRWNHPTLGPIRPDEFVPLVEHTTLVNAMTDWTLDAALSQVALWRADGLDPQISINISMYDLRDDHFTARLTELLERHAVRPDWIDIEVTESALMKDPVHVGHQLDEIRRLGVGIEIDDYGTGQSGLSYLKYIPASYLKIDQSFISHLPGDRTDRILVRSTINLAHELDLRVVAEGIRDEAGLDWLREHGCDIGQGNLLSPPLEAMDFERLLRTQLMPHRLP